MKSSLTWKLRESRIKGMNFWGNKEVTDFVIVDQLKPDGTTCSSEDRAIDSDSISRGFKSLQVLPMESKH